MSPTLTLDTHFNAGPIDRRIFSGFLEHLGRSIYEGIYDPGNPLSDARGFRRDVVAAIKPMRMPLVRWPGGNFVSSYDWTDGIGPRANRPARPDFAWKSVETNQIGVDEFCDWCGLIDSKPMLAVNLGTEGAKEAVALVEYCNMPRGTYWADRRVANGHAQPHAVKTWCLGNEMDGPWQAGQVPADEYARRADQAGKMMKGLDPSIELIIAGSSGRTMNTYMHWDRTILEYCWDRVDFISAHRYSGNRSGSPEFLAEGVEIDRIIQDYRALLGYVRAVKRSDRNVHVSFDEWNVWYKNHEMDGKWKAAPHLLEEVYNFEDALVCAQYLTTFIRNADVVKIACLAQMVNVIAPILTRRDGLLIQSIYHLFVMLAQYTRGFSLTPRLDGPTYKAGNRGECPSLDTSASFDPVTGEACVTIVNRDMKLSQTIEVRFDDRVVTKVIGAETLAAKNLKAANSWTRRNVVSPKAVRAKIVGGIVRVSVAAPGMVVVRLATRAK